MNPVDQYDVAVATIIILVGIASYLETKDGALALTIVAGLWAAYWLGQKRTPKG